MLAHTESPLAIYRSYLAKHQLAYQFSPQAGKAIFFPRLVCPYTGSTALQWRISRGLGTVYATTVVYPREGTPYHVGLIDLDEGFRMMSRVEGLDPIAVRIGLRVKVHVIQDADASPLPIFLPAAQEVVS